MVRSIGIIFGVLLLALIGTQTYAAQKGAANERPTIGLVLSGGGARGAAHVGVLKVLEDLRIPIDIITGTSMGAVVGGLYAFGYSSAELEKLLVEIDWDDVFVDKPPRKQLNYRRKEDDNNFLIKLEIGFKDGKFVVPTGLVQGQKMNLLLKSLTLSAPEHFDDLPIPFRAVAADIETGEAVILSDGNLATAMRASLSIPGVFSPVDWNGRLLVDGGLANNVPVQLAREMGAEILIVVDLSGEPRQRAELSSPISILNQTIGYQILRNSAEQLSMLGPGDVLIQPDTSKYSSTDFKASTDMLSKGFFAANAKSEMLKRLSVTESEYKVYQASQQKRPASPPHIDKIVFDNQSSLSTDVIQSHIEMQPSDTLDIEALETDLEKLYGLDIFKSVDYDIIQGPEQNQITIKTDEKDWGPNYMRFGMNLESDLEGSSTFNVAASYTVTPINDSGGEWRTEVQVGHNQGFVSEFYQPLDKRLRYFINSWAGYSETHVARYESGRQAADYIASVSQIGLGVGRLFGNCCRMGIFVNTGSGDTEPNIGDLSVRKNTFDIGAWDTGFWYDQMDSLNFPKNGLLMGANWTSNRKNLGADVEQDSLRISILHASTGNKNTFLLWSGLGGVINSETPAQSGFAIGGFLSLSGYENSELSGRYAGVLRLIYFRELGGSRSVLKVPIYVGGSFETGNVWNDKQDIRFDSLLFAGSVMLSLDTPIGPLYLANGFAEGGRSKQYLFLGRSFTFF